MSSQLDDLFKEFPEPVREPAQSAWRALSPETRNNVEQLLPMIPTGKGGVQQLMAMAQSHVTMAFGRKQKVAIVGPTNVGKSTLYNQLVRQKVDRAAVSPIPGTTKVAQSAETGLFDIIDTPGADAVGMSGLREHEIALEAARSADFLLIMFDAVQGIKRGELDLFLELKALGKPFIVVLNKMDIVRKNEGAVLAQAARNLGLMPEQLIPISAENGENLTAVVLAIAKVEPELLVALGRALPEYRSRMTWQLISGAATMSAVVALTPIPIMDFVPLLGVQASMVLGLARIYNEPMNLKRARELIGVFGLGLLGRTLFYQLIKLGGPPTWLIGSAVAASTTVVLGYSAVLWFEQGETLDEATRKRLLATVSGYLTESLKGLGRNKPSRDALSEQIRQALAQEDVVEEMVSAETKPATPADGHGELIVIEETDLPPVENAQKKRRWRLRKQ
ncbi:MAG: 50S ribosome-binding GTPase [Anaerolineae bacterium]|nr:50S ribosome-binding GTPase [Anaerolineae bacterium]